MIRRALELDPESPAIIDSHGWVLFRQGKFEAALAELERAYGLMKDAEIAAHIIEVLWNLEREEDAVAFMAQADIDYPNNMRLAELRERLLNDGD